MSSEIELGKLNGKGDLGEVSRDIMGWGKGEWKEDMLWVLSGKEKE